MKSLSRREKLMVYIMILALVIGGGFMGLRYITPKYKASVTAKDDAQMELLVQSSNSIDAEALNAEIANLKKICKKYNKQYKPLMSSDLIEKDALSYATKRHLKAEATSYSLDDEQAATATGQAITLAGGATLVSEETPTNVSLSKIKISLQIKGAFADFCDYVNDIAKSKYMRISSFRVFDEKDRVGYHVHNQTPYTYYVDLTYYMAG